MSSLVVSELCQRRIKNATQEDKSGTESFDGPVVCKHAVSSGSFQLFIRYLPVDSAAWPLVQISVLDDACGDILQERDW